MCIARCIVVSDRVVDDEKNKTMNSSLRAKRRSGYNDIDRSGPSTPSPPLASSIDLTDLTSELPTREERREAGDAYSLSRSAFGGSAYEELVFFVDVVDEVAELGRVEEALSGSASPVEDGNEHALQGAQGFD